MRVVIFLDLDDTLFQTKRKCPSSQLTPAAVGRDGLPLSFMTEKQQALWGFLNSSSTIIPTTARNHDAFRRVQLSFSSQAILDFGGVILLPSGTPDPGWDQHIRTHALADAKGLEELAQKAQALADEVGPGLSVRVISDFGMPLYLVAKQRRDLPDAESQLAQVRDGLVPELDPGAFRVHLNDNNLSILPSWLGKEFAVQYVLDHHLADEPTLTLGMGDSLTDAGFLALCDHALISRNSQLHQSLLPSGKVR